MVILHWIFCNGHEWSNEFTSEQTAMDYVNLCDMVRSPWIDRVYIETTEGKDILIKEKA